MRQEIVSLTRVTLDSLTQFKFKKRINVIANDEIPAARDCLQYVIEKTEGAANKTSDAVDRCMPIADNLH